MAFTTQVAKILKKNSKQYQDTRNKITKKETKKAGNFCPRFDKSVVHLKI